MSLYDVENQSSYNRNFENDTPNEAIRLFIEEILMWKGENEERSTKIFFFSGRNGKYEAQTRAFLNSCFDSDVEWNLIMRDEKDQRRDSIIKLEMFEKYIRNKYNVLCVFDDRL